MRIDTCEALRWKGAPTMGWGRSWHSSLAAHSRMADQGLKPNMASLLLREAGREGMFPFQQHFKHCESFFYLK